MSGLQHFVRGEGKLSIPSHLGPQPANDRRRLAQNAKLPVPGTPRKPSAPPASSANPAFAAPAPLTNPAYAAPPAYGKPFRPTSAQNQFRNVDGQDEKAKQSARRERDAYDTDAESLDTTIHGARSGAPSVVQVKDSQAPEFTQAFSDEIEHDHVLASDDEGEGELQSNEEGDVEDRREHIDPRMADPPQRAFLNRKLMLNEEDLISYPTTTSGRMEDEEGGASSEPEPDPVHSPSPQRQRRRLSRPHIDEVQGAQHALQLSNLPFHTTVSTRQLPDVGASRSRSFPNLPTQDSDKPRTGGHVLDQSRQQAAVLRAAHKPQVQHTMQPVARPKSVVGRIHPQTSQATPRSQKPAPPTFNQGTQPPAYSQIPQNGHELDTPGRELFKHATQPHQAKAQSVNTTVTAQAQYQRESLPSMDEEQELAAPLEDYDTPDLFGMDYSTLKTESFDTVPRGNPSPLDDLKKETPLPERLAFVQKKLAPEDQNKFFSSITTREWEEAGDWFLERFGDIVKKMTEVRKQKRKRAMEFEDEVEKRHEHVAKRHKIVEDAMINMRTKGQTLLPRSPRRDL